LEKKLEKFFADAGLEVQMTSRENSLVVNHKTRKQKVLMLGKHYSRPPGQTYKQTQLLGPEKDGIFLQLLLGKKKQYRFSVSALYRDLPWKVYETSMQLENHDQQLNLVVTFWYGVETKSEMIKELKAIITSCAKENK